MTKKKSFLPEALDSTLLPKPRKPIPHAFVLDALSGLSPYTVRCLAALRLLKSRTMHGRIGAGSARSCTALLPQFHATEEKEK